MIQKSAGQAHFESGCQPKVPYNQEAFRRAGDDLWCLPLKGA